MSLGMPFPGLRIRIKPELDPMSYVISILEVPTARGEVKKNSVLAFSNADRITKIGLRGDAAPATFVRDNVFWIDANEKRTLNKSDVKFWSVTTLLIFHLEAVVQLYAHRMLGLQDVQTLVQAVAAGYPDLVRETMKVIPLPRLTKILKGLASEGISLRNLRDIMQTALELAAFEKDDENLIERIRGGLSSAITYRFSRGNRKISAYLLAPATEEQIRSSITTATNGISAALAPKQAKALLEAIRSTILSHQKADMQPTLHFSLARKTRKSID